MATKYHLVADDHVQGLKFIQFKLFVIGTSKSEAKLLEDKVGIQQIELPEDRLMKGEWMLCFEAIRQV